MPSPLKSATATDCAVPSGATRVAGPKVPSPLPASSWTPVESV